MHSTSSWDMGAGLQNLKGYNYLTWSLQCLRGKLVKTCDEFLKKSLTPLKEYLYFMTVCHAISHVFCIPEILCKVGQKNAVALMPSYPFMTSSRTERKLHISRIFFKENNHTLQRRQLFQSHICGRNLSPLIRNCGVVEQLLLPQQVCCHFWKAAGRCPSCRDGFSNGLYLIKFFFIKVITQLE